jgi:SanA protein
MRVLSKNRVLWIVAGSLLIIIVAVVYLSNRVIESASEGKLYSSTKDIPHNNVGLLLGTAKYIATGVMNPYYAYRIDAAALLMRSGKIDYLIISGDNSRKEYNEPQSMKDDLGARGIDTSRIYLDYAGFRTFDSIVRLREIFSQDSATIISQPFHNQRAVFVAQEEGITAIGFNAQDVPEGYGFWVQFREKLARAKVFIDILLETRPRFLGEKISIPREEKGVTS